MVNILLIYYRKPAELATSVATSALFCGEQAVPLLNVDAANITNKGFALMFPSAVPPPTSVHMFLICACAALLKSSAASRWPAIRELRLLSRSFAASVKPTCNTLQACWSSSAVYTFSSCRMTMLL